MRWTAHINARSMRILGEAMHAFPEKTFYVYYRLLEYPQYLITDEIQEETKDTILLAKNDGVRIVNPKTGRDY
jgi:hypothetical protein